MIEQNKFRRDLYYRLRGVTIQLPALREHRDDIAELAHYFLFRLNRSLGTQIETISENAIAVLQEHAWPGNVRELQCVIREAMIATTGPTLLEEFLPRNFAFVRQAEIAADEVRDFRSGPDAWSNFGATVESILEQRRGFVYRESQFEFDRILIQRAMSITDGNQAKAADMLGISRPTLKSKLRTILQPPSIRPNESNS